MSFLVAAPDTLAASAADLAAIGSSLSEANVAATASTTGLIAAGGDEVSAAIASLFSSHGKAFQALSAQAAAFHDQFVQALKAGAGAYASTEAANASSMLQQVLKGGQVAQLASWGQTLENLPALPGRLGRTAASGINQWANNIVTNIFGTPATPAIPATQNPTFTGTPSLATRIEVAALPVFLKPFENLFGFGTGLQLLSASPIISTSPPRILTWLLGETVQQSTYDGMTVLQITPAHPDGMYVVALHGGAYVLQPTILHWLDYTVTAYQTGATLEVPLYPLAGHGGTAGTVVPETASLISMEIGLHGAEHVSVLGDSAGGGIALGAVEYLVANNQTVPASMVLLSPWLDVALNNPNISLVSDPILPLGFLQQTGQEWAGNLPENNYLASPLYGSLQGLPPTYVYSGSREILAPDVLVLSQEAATQGAPISFVLRTGEMHDWALPTTLDGLYYRSQIYQELGLE